jgi:predicted aspartyl protease
MEILNERPKMMSFREYKTHLREQKAWIKNRNKGVFVYISCRLIEHEIAGVQTQVWNKYPPFVGCAKNLKEQ